MDNSVLASKRLNESQNHDDFQIVWFSLDQKIPDELYNLNDYLEKCHSFEECDRYISEVQSDRIILLVLVDLFEFASHFNDLRQIHLIYVLEKIPENVRYEKEKYSKLVDIFTDEHKLIERLRQDIILTFRNDLPLNNSCLKDMTIERSLTSFDSSTVMFLWHQVYTYYLVNLPDVDENKLKDDMNKMKDEMIEQCRLENKDVKDASKKIDEFSRECTVNNALYWYSKDSFVYRLVNRAFRTRNINLIGKFRYFIILLYRNLKDLSEKQQDLNCTTVYRGQLMEQNELENLKKSIDHLISINTIMSTTRDESTARVFVFGAKVVVIFKIDIGDTHNNTLFPFADISSVAKIPDEQEILFFPGTVFRIKSVDQENDFTWIIKLTLENETVQQMEDLMKRFKTLINYTRHHQQFFTKTDDFNLFKKYHRILTNKSFTWKDLFTTLKDINPNYIVDNYNDSEKLIEHYKNLILNKNFIDHPKFIVLNILIGNNYFRRFEYNNALFYYAIVFSLLDDRNWLTGELYHHIGDVWRSINNFTNALSCYEEAVKILSSYYVKDRYIARIYRKMSYIYKQQNNSYDANIYEEQANEMDRNFRQRSDLDHEVSLQQYQNQLDNSVDLTPHQRADILFSIGICFIREEEYSQAKESLEQAKQLFMDNLPSYDCFAHKFASVYEALALIYIIEDDNFKALTNWRKAIDIRTSFLKN